MHARGQKKEQRATARARAALTTKRPAHASTHATGARYPPLPYAPRSQASSTYIIYLLVCGCRSTCVHSSGGARAWRGCGVQATPYPPALGPNYRANYSLLPPPANTLYHVVRLAATNTTVRTWLMELFPSFRRSSKKSKPEQQLPLSRPHRAR